MTPIKVKITDKNLEVVMDKTMNCGCSDFESIQLLHDEMSAQYPDCFVNFSWHPAGQEQSSFICGMPLNMKRDELAMERDEMTWEEYQEKWYSMPEETEEDKWVRNVETRAELRWLMN